MVLVRQEIGDVLRDFRLQKGQTLRQVAGRATVALGYLSEVERGQKEASSEILASLADALDVPISVIMREVSDRLAIVEGVKLEQAFANGDLPSYIPDTFPASFLADSDPELASTR
jgi:transcriptional regulator with XRE-family HTH domain